MKLFIKNMVCNRCKLAVKAILEKIELPFTEIVLGEETLKHGELSVTQLEQLDRELSALGFELIDDRRSRIIEKIKNTVIHIVHHLEEPITLKNSEYISSQLHYDYSYLSRLFSEVEGITIEQYIINQKIERAKELLVYDEYNISELADKLGYSSVAHLSAQFKKATGMTPTQFKTLHHRPRKSLDEVGK